jgi:hypothetical protein
MEKVTLYDLMEEIIFKVSSKVNKKALREVIANFDDWDDLNYILINYYNRVHRVKNDNLVNLVNLVYLEDFENEEDFNAEIKSLYNTKIYENKYDYVNGGKITQKNTGLVLVYSNGFRDWTSWAFDVYKYLEVKGLTEEDIIF